MTNTNTADALYTKLYKEVAGWTPKETEALRLEKVDKGWHGQKLADLKNQEIASGQTKQAVGFANLIITENKNLDSYAKLKMLKEIATEIKKHAEDPRLYIDPRQKEMADQMHQEITNFLITDARAS
jgi:hypothetical protein